MEIDLHCLIFELEFKSSLPWLPGWPIEILDGCTVLDLRNRHCEILLYIHFVPWENKASKIKHTKISHNTNKFFTSANFTLPTVSNKDKPDFTLTHPPTEKDNADSRSPITQAKSLRGSFVRTAHSEHSEGGQSPRGGRRVLRPIQIFHRQIATRSGLVGFLAENTEAFSEIASEISYVGLRNFWNLNSRDVL